MVYIANFFLGDDPTKTPIAPCIMIRGTEDYQAAASYLFETLVEHPDYQPIFDDSNKKLFLKEIIGVKKDGSHISPEDQACLCALFKETAKVSR